MVFLGDGVPVYKSIIEEKLINIHFYAPANISKQKASVAVLGKMYYNRRYYRNSRKPWACIFKAFPGRKKETKRIRKTENDYG